MEELTKRPEKALITDEISHILIQRGGDSLRNERLSHVAESMHLMEWNLLRRAAAASAGSGSDNR